MPSFKFEQHAWSNQRTLFRTTFRFSLTVFRRLGTITNAKRLTLRKVGKVPYSGVCVTAGALERSENSCGQRSSSPSPHFTLVPFADKDGPGARRKRVVTIDTVNSSD